jgi:very-short-patch-repair endonuclease
MGWAVVAKQQAGIVTRQQLREAGLSQRSVTVMLQSGELESVHHGIHIVRGAPVTYEARLWAAVLATGGVLGFATAAHLWGIEEHPPARIDVIVERGPHIVAPALVRLHRIDLRSGSTQRRHGLPITTRQTTVLDHAGRLRRREADDVMDRALQLGWLQRRDIERRLQQQPGRTGNVTLRRILDATADGAAARSERVLHQLLRQASLSGWQANYDVWRDGVLIGVIDVAFVKERIAIEVDGWAFHIGRSRFQRDRTRQNELSGVGWTVLRFTWADLIERPGYVTATIRRQLAAAA